MIVVGIARHHRTAGSVSECRGRGIPNVIELIILIIERLVVIGTVCISAVGRVNVGSVTVGIVRLFPRMSIICNNLYPTEFVDVEISVVG